MDSITLEFTNKDGNYLWSLKEFILVLVIDSIVPVPKPTNEAKRVSLFEARNMTMNQLRKSLRTDVRVRNFLNMPVLKCNFIQSIATKKLPCAVSQGAKKSAQFIRARLKQPAIANFD